MAWRPFGAVHEGLSQKPWTVTEAKDTQRAVRIGVNEVIEFFEDRPGRVKALGEDAVESLLDPSFGARDLPDVKRRARTHARRALDILLAPELTRDPSSRTEDDLANLLVMSTYAHILLDPDDLRREELTKWTNRALRDASSFSGALGVDHPKTLSNGRIRNEDALELVLWTITLIDAHRIPGLELPREASTFVRDTWRLLPTYPLVSASERAKGGNDTRFYHDAYLATHMGYIPTGYGRHRIRQSETRWLYRFLRENFYAVLEMGELDLVAEFVDLLRQYGFTEEDQQVRDGTRHLLRLFHAAGDRWMNHRESWEARRLAPYHVIHKPWTGIAGVRTREPEPVTRGSYGAAFYALTNANGRRKRAPGRAPK